MDKLGGKIALVTGGSEGMSFDMAKEFINYGVPLVPLPEKRIPQRQPDSSPQMIQASWPEWNFR